jgi:hypothetical protein
MSKESDNKAIVGRWFTEFWGATYNPGVVDELAAPGMLLQYSLHASRRGHEDIKAFMSGFREAFPDLNFWGAADLIAEGDFLDWEYAISCRGKPVAQVSKKFFAFTDTYGIDIDDGQDDILIIASAVVIDLCCHQKDR